MAYPRYAIYFTPPPDSPLANFGASVLGYDVYERTDIERFVDGTLTARTLASITTEPRRYGFHATFVAPFHLEGPSEDELLSSLDAFTRDNLPVNLGPLLVDNIGAFIALKPESSVPKIDDLAASLVEYFDRYRAAPTEVVKARRASAHLSSRQRELLGRWGYPFVFDQFRFHMTLTNKLQAAELGKIKAAMTAMYGAMAQDHVEIDALSLVRQDDAQTPFFVVSRKRFKGRAK